MKERMTDKQTELSAGVSLTDRVKSFFSRKEESPEKTKHDEKVMLSRRKFLKMAGGATAAVVAANAVPSVVVKASEILTGNAKNITDPVAPRDKGDGFPPKGGKKVSRNENSGRREQGEVTKYPVNVLQMFPLSQKEKDAIGSGTVTLESGSPLDTARQKIIDEYKFPEGIVEAQVAYNPDTANGGVYLEFIKDQDIKFLNNDKPVTFTKDSVMYSGGHYLIEEKGLEVVPVVVDKPLHDFFNGIVLEKGVVEAPDINSIVMVARDPKTKEIKTWLGDDMAYSIDDGSVKSTPDAVPTKDAPMAKIEIGNDAPKGIEYWQSLSQEQLADIEKSASFRFKDYKNFKPLSLSYLQFTRGYSGVKDSIEVYAFPILLEKPNLEKMQITDISTGSPKDVEVYTAPVLLKTSQGKYEATKVVFSPVALPMLAQNTSSDGVIGGSPKGDFKGISLTDLVAKIKPGEQYGMNITSPGIIGKEKDFMKAVKASFGSRWKDSYDDQLDTYVSLMAMYDKNVRGLAPFSSQPSSIVKVLGTLAPIDTIMVGPQWG